MYYPAILDVFANPKERLFPRKPRFYLNPGDRGGGGPTDPPLLYFYAPRVNETKLNLFAS